MAYKPRFRGLTAKVMRKLINDQLDAGEPLSEPHREFLDDCMTIAIETEKPPRKTNAARDLAIAQMVDRYKDLFGESLLINGKAVKTAYYRKADAGDPAIAEQVDISSKLYPTKPNREAESVFDVVGKSFCISGEAVKKAYYKAVKTPEYLAGQAARNEGEPDYE